MKIGLNAGHTISGSGYGAIGRITESVETRAVIAALSLSLKNAGVEIIDCTIDKADSQADYLNKVVELANKQDLDWFISVHFNAGGGQGAEVYTYEGRKYQDALDVCNNLAAFGFKNRGVKSGSGLYVIKKTKAKAMLIEVCFVDSADAELYRSIGADKIAQAITAALTDYVGEDKADIPDNETLIMGESIATAEQLNAYLLAQNPQAASYLHLANIFIDEGKKEGVRGDIAFCQSLKETGYFKFGGDVVPEQHNYAGIGTVGAGVKGACFSDDNMGIRAQIQHLKAYATADQLNQTCVDPRYSLVSPKGKAPTVEQLSGKWAVPGYDNKKHSSLNAAMKAGESYGHDIINHLKRAIVMPIDDSFKIDAAVMKNYIGVKIVKAEPMEKDGEPGYRILYPDGYKSWSPKEVFENAYRILDCEDFINNH